MEEVFDYFANCLLSRRELEGTPKHELVDMRTLAAVYESAQRGERIEIYPGKMQVWTRTK